MRIACTELGAALETLLHSRNRTAQERDLAVRQLSRVCDSAFASAEKLGQRFEIPVAYLLGPAAAERATYIRGILERLPTLMAEHAGQPGTG